ncbi:UNVERIFIED_CONTAM: Major strawberry allergen Fra a 1-2 [Sesamum latifolium]|uniref:Major strawberry allergen Fra a 1-2 n=1 Tax=Sesamum latifolium TaxID=2727402 RepID=A0AAW2VVU6_9LAMI
MPQAMKSIKIIQSDASTGSIKQIKFVKDELNEKTFTYGYKLIDGDSLVANLEKITYEVKFEQSADDGSISKVTSKYYTVGDFTLKEDEVKAGKERVLVMYKAVEAFLIQNPDAYV